MRVYTHSPNDQKSWFEVYADWNNTAREDETEKLSGLNEQGNFASHLCRSALDKCACLAPIRPHLFLLSELRVRWLLIRRKEVVAHARPLQEVTRQRFEVHFWGARLSSFETRRSKQDAGDYVQTWILNSFPLLLHWSNLPCINVQLRSF